MINFNPPNLTFYSDSPLFQIIAESSYNSNILEYEDGLKYITSDDRNYSEIYHGIDYNKEINEKPKIVFMTIKVSEMKELPELYTENQINNKIKGMDLSEDMKRKILLDKNIENVHIIKTSQSLDPNSKKRNKPTMDQIKKKSLGRKVLNSTEEVGHTKYDSDNLVKKIKIIVNDNLFEFLNSLLKSIYNKDIKQKNKVLTLLKLRTRNSSKTNIEIMKMSSAFRSENTKSDDNIILLNSTLKEYFSHEISPKYSENNYEKNYNEILIETLLNDENNKNIFNFLFNRLTFEDFLDLFSYKKQLSDFVEYNSLTDAQKKEIEDNLYECKIEQIVNDIYNEDYIYFHCFFLLLYNLKRYFVNKEKRKPRKKKDENLKEISTTQMEIEK